jgi:hypothetical protein
LQNPQLMAQGHDFQVLVVGLFPPEGQCVDYQQYHHENRVEKHGILLIAAQRLSILTLSQSSPSLRMYFRAIEPVALYSIFMEPPRGL